MLACSNSQKTTPKALFCINIFLEQCIWNGWLVFINIQTIEQCHSTHLSPWFNHCDIFDFFIIINKLYKHYYYVVSAHKIFFFFQGDPGDIGFPGKKGETVKLFFQ